MRVLNNNFNFQPRFVSIFLRRDDCGRTLPNPKIPFGPQDSKVICSIAFINEEGSRVSSLECISWPSMGHKIDSAEDNPDREPPFSVSSHTSILRLVKTNHGERNKARSTLDEVRWSRASWFLRKYSFKWFLIRESFKVNLRRSRSALPKRLSTKIFKRSANDDMILEFAFQ